MPFALPRSNGEDKQNGNSKGAWFSTQRKTTRHNLQVDNIKLQISHFLTKEKVINIDCLYYTKANFLANII